jgi:peptidoglycan/LPS O-acetylase OafA/YrhL
LSSAPRLKSAAHAPALDILRAGAALTVMLGHLRDQYFASYSGTACASRVFRAVFFFVTRLGLEAVLVFFVLSGFLVGGMSVERYRQGRFEAGKYAIDRFTRIYTPLVPALLFALALCVITRVPFAWGNLGVNLSSLQGVFGDPFPFSGALWSLSYEVWFYVLCGAAICVAVSKSRVGKAAAVVALAAAAWIFTRLDAVYLAVWLLGAGSYFLPPPRWRKSAAAVVLGAIAASVVLTQVTSETKQADLRRFQFVSHDIAILLLGLSIALAIPILLGAKFGSRTARLGTFFAGFSYSLYLIHLPMEWVLLQTGLLRRHDEMNAAAMAGYVGLAVVQVAVAWVFYYCFERHTGKLRRWLGRYSSGRPDSLRAFQPPSSEITFR